MSRWRTTSAITRGCSTATSNVSVIKISGNYQVEGVDK
jgi:hypothetical protein